MSLHVFGNMVTGYGCAANNRGETDGNITTLQKLLWRGQVHTTVSAEAIRWALRYYWQIKGTEVNRRWDDIREEHQWRDGNWEGWTEKDGKTYIDDDLLGYMRAEGAREEGEKGTTNKRRGVFEVSRAISTTPYVGDISFNAKSGIKDRTSLYGTEMHATRYQYGFSMTPERLKIPSRCLNALDAVTCLGEVAGNHSRFLFDFSPESIIIRLAHDPAPRILYCLEEENGTIHARELARKIQADDIKKDELFIGGMIANAPEIVDLKMNGNVFPGVKQAVEAAKTAIKQHMDLNHDGSK